MRGPWAPTGQQIIIGVDDWKNWDTIDHEFGHIVQYQYGFFTENVIFDHVAGENLRVQHPLALRSQLLSLAFKEGFADFFSMYSQQVDNTAPEFEFFHDPNRVAAQDEFTRDMLYHRYTVVDSSVGASGGEDEELTVMRVLWNILHPSPIPFSTFLDFQGLYEVIANRNPPPGSNTVVARTLSDLWKDLVRRNGTSSASGRQALANFGTIFEQFNVSPNTHESDGGMEINLVQATNGNWSATDDADSVPVFRFKVPVGIAPVGQLLSTFSITFFSADYTQTSTFTDNFIALTTNWVRWTPTAAQWNDQVTQLTAGNSGCPNTVHWVAAGGWGILGNSTGLYWSGANDIYIGP